MIQPNDRLPSAQWIRMLLADDAAGFRSRDGAAGATVPSRARRCWGGLGGSRAQGAWSWGWMVWRWVGCCACL